MAFYHKYRPQTLDQLVGQTFVRKTLQAAINKKRLAHAYLFFGSRGTGKTSTARIIAREILLDGIENDRHQSALEEMRHDRFVDLIEIDGASNRKIEHARALIEKIHFSPTMGTRKVYIIDEVHMLTKEAFNALLKTLEEPPDHAYFLLATTEPQKVPETIRSRCQTFIFHRFTDEQIATRLAEVAKAENISVEHDALLLIAKKSAGGLRDALTLFEQASSAGSVSVTHLQKELGIASRSHLETFDDFLCDGKTAEAIAFVGEMSGEGLSLGDFLEQLLGFYREKMLLASAEKNTNLLRNILKTIALFESARRDERDAVIPTLPLEIAIVRRTQLFSETEEKKISPEKITRTAPNKSSLLKEMNSHKKKLPSASLSEDNFPARWTIFLEGLSNALLRLALKNARVTFSAPQNIHLSFSAESWKKQVESHFDDLLALIISHFKTELSVEMTVTPVVLEPVNGEQKISDFKKKEISQASLTPEMISKIMGL